MRLLIRLVLLAVLVCGLLSFLTYSWFHNGKTAFLGDSLTQGWYLPENNFGVYGETSAKIMLRQHYGFNTNYVLAGTNDVMLGVPQTVTLANLSQIAENYKAHGECTVLATIPPIHAKNDVFMPAVIDLNEHIQSLGTRLGVPVVDYFDMLKDHPTAQSDGVHMKRSGYLYMDIALLKSRILNPTHC